MEHFTAEYRKTVERAAGPLREALPAEFGQVEAAYLALTQLKLQVVRELGRRAGSLAAMMDPEGPAELDLSFDNLVSSRRRSEREQELQAVIQAAERSLAVQMTEGYHQYTAAVRDIGAMELDAYFEGWFETAKD